MNTHRRMSKFTVYYLSLSKQKSVRDCKKCDLSLGPPHMCFEVPFIHKWQHMIICSVSTGNWPYFETGSRCRARWAHRFHYCTNAAQSRFGGGGFLVFIHLQSTLKFSVIWSLRIRPCSLSEVLYRSLLHTAHAQGFVVRTNANRIFKRHCRKPRCW